jgi:hypothetical protein
VIKDPMRPESGYAILPQSIAFAVVEEVDQARVKEIASLLSKKAAGFGRPWKGPYARSG